MDENHLTDGPAPQWREPRPSQGTALWERNPLLSVLQPDGVFLVDNECPSLVDDTLDIHSRALPGYLIALQLRVGVWYILGAHSVGVVMSDSLSRAALNDAAIVLQASLERLLTERAQITALIALDSRSAHLSTLTSALSRIDREIGEQLSRWLVAGGTFSLGGDAIGSLSLGAVESEPTPIIETPVATRVRRQTGPVVHLGGEVDSQWREEFGSFLHKIGPGRDLAGEIDIVVEAAMSCDRWSRWPKYVQRHLVGLLACRLRSLQDEQGVPEYELQDGFSALTRFSKRVKPGFVFGLSRGHRPQHGASWDHDAVRHFDQLCLLRPSGVQATEEQEEALSALSDWVAKVGEDSSPRTREAATKALATALETGVDARDPAIVVQAMALQPLPDERPYYRMSRAVADAALPATSNDLDLPPDWGWWIHTRGCRLLFVGDEVSAETLDAWRRVFGLESASFVDDEAAVETVRAKGCDMVVSLGAYLSNMVEAQVVPLCVSHGISVVQVDHGHGASVLKSAIERFTERQGEASL